MGDVTHTFVSPVTDAGDPDLVGPDEWNSTHDVTLTAADVGAAATGHDHDADYEATGAVATHSSDTTAVHGITDSSTLTTNDHDHDGAPTAKLTQANTHESPDTDTGTSSLHHTIGSGANQSAAGNHTHQAGDIAVTFSKQGTLTTQTGALRWYNDSGRTLTVIAVRASAGTAPTGAAIIVDVNEGGTTLYTTQGNRPTIAISGNTTDATLPDDASIADNGFLTVDIDQIGSTIAGADLTVTVWLR